MRQSFQHEIEAERNKLKEEAEEKNRITENLLETQKKSHQEEVRCEQEMIEIEKKAMLF